MGGSKGGSSIPKPPGIGKTYKKGVDAYLSELPRILGSEQSARDTYDPQRIQEQQDLQDKFGPHQYDEQLSALNQLDPQWMAAHKQLGDSITSDLAKGMNLTDDQKRVIEQDLRGSQSARGNIMGDSAGLAEAYTLGDRGLQLYQQRVNNAQSFLQSNSVPLESSLVSPVSPDRSSAYVDPNAGWQGVNAANARYQAQVGAQAANQQAAGQKKSSTGSTVGAVAGAVGVAL
jgi:hypothetical protein